VSDLPNQSRPASGSIYERHQLDAVAARWDAKARTWDSDLLNRECHLNEDDAYPRFLREASLLIEAHREFCTGQGVLDVGCGTGLVLAELIPAFAWGLGVDISAQMIDRAVQKQIPRARFVVADCFRMPELCAPAGAAISRGVLLSHYGRVQGEQLLAACGSALVKGGFLIFDFLNQAAQIRHAHQPEHKTYFTPESVCLMARRTGFARASILGGDPRERRVLLLLAQRD